MISLDKAVTFFLFSSKSRRVNLNVFYFNCIVFSRLVNYGDYIDIMLLLIMIDLKIINYTSTMVVSTEALVKVFACFNVVNKIFLRINTFIT